MRCIGILSLLLGWLWAHHAQAAQPQISDIVGGVVIDITTTLLIKALKEAAHNDNDPNDTTADKTWVGYQTQAGCTPSVGSTVPGGAGLPCSQNVEFPSFGAGLQIIRGLTSADCYQKSMNGAAAIKGTDIPIKQAVGKSGLKFGDIVTPFGPSTPGGICDQGGFAHFTGVLDEHHNIFDPFGSGPLNHISNIACAFVVNGATGPASCGVYSVPGP